MKASQIFLAPICALSLAGCQTTAINEGTGYSLLTPSPVTARTIVVTDRKFAEQVAAHNRQCRKDKGCSK